MSESPAATLELSSDSYAAISAARQFVRGALDGVVPKAVSGDLELATSELVTNAIEHGERVPVVVIVRVDGHRASVSIESSGGFPIGAADTDAWVISSPDRPTGRGLGIVRAIADDIDVVTRGAHVSITVHRNLPDAR